MKSPKRRRAPRSTTGSRSRPSVATAHTSRSRIRRRPGKRSFPSHERDAATSSCRGPRAWVRVRRDKTDVDGRRTQLSRRWCQDRVRSLADLHRPQKAVTPVRVNLSGPRGAISFRQMACPEDGTCRTRRRKTCRDGRRSRLARTATRPSTRWAHSSAARGGRAASSSKREPASRKVTALQLGSGRLPQERAITVDGAAPTRNRPCG